METITNESIVILVLRVILGVMFFLQGYDKIFKLGMQKVIESYEHELGHVKIPNFIIVPSAFYTSFVEFIGGLMLILGLYSKYALFAIGIDLMMVVFVFSLMQPLWDMKFVFPRLIIWCAVMVIPSNYDVFSMDYLLFRKL